MVPGGFGAPPSPSQGGAEAAAEIERTRRRLEQEPALPAARNPLLGQWRLEKAPARPKGGLGEMMAAITGGACQMLSGDGIWDFRAKSMHGIDRGVGETELDKVEYPGNTRTVAVLPQRMFRLLMFEFESPSRMRFVGQDCVMVRVGGANSATGGSAGAATLAAVQAERPAAEVKGPERPPPEVCRRMLMDRFGAAREAEVRQALQARFRETITHGLAPPQSPSRLAGTSPTARIVLQDLPERSLLLEAYAAPR